MLLVFALSALANSACARKKEYPKAPEYTRLPNGEFPIAASYAFYDPYITPQQFQWVREAGFNILRKILGPADIDRTLPLAAANDLYVMVSTGGLTDTARIPGIVEKYKDNPTVWGYNVADEPGASQFRHLGVIMRELERLDPGKNGFINLLPAVGKKGLQAKNYKTYVEDYVTTVNPPFISFDCYPVCVDGEGRNYIGGIYYKTIEEVARVARESNRPFWSYILSVKHAFYSRPTEEFIRFQVFTSLGYGAQGIIYFTYLMPDFDKGKGEFSDAPIDWDGNRTKTWYSVRDVNCEVHNLSHVFLGSEVVSVAHAGKSLPDGVTRLKKLPEPFRNLEVSGPGVMVSHLVNGEDSYLLVVNRDLDNQQRIYLSHNEPVTRLFGDGTTQTVGGSDFTLEPAGYLLLSWK